MSTILPDEIFLLYGGSSPDGMGPGKYEGRTADPKEAYAHFKRAKADPYSTGHVDRITATTRDRMYADKWKRYGFV